MSARRNAPLPLSFAAIDSLNRPNRLSGLTFASGDAQISMDGDDWVATTNVPVELGSSGRYTFVLTAAEMDAKWVHIKVVKSSIDEVDILFPTSGHPSGSVSADGSNSATSFLTNRTETDNDHWKDALLTFTTGDLTGQVKKVSAYNGTTKIITVSGAFTGAPATGDRYLLIEV